MALSRGAGQRCWLFVLLVAAWASSGGFVALAAALPGVSVKTATGLGQAPAKAAQDEPAPTCASCHAEEAATQPLSGMGRALVAAGVSPLAGHAQKLTFSRGVYRYTVEATPRGASYTVTDGQSAISVPILWSFGAGNMTWLLEYQGKMYESLVSFYSKSNGLGVTTGDTRHEPATLLEAFGRLQTAVDVKVCFGCHATSPMEALPAGYAGGAPGGASGKQGGVLEAHSSPAGVMLAAAGGLIGMPDARTLEAGVQCEHCHLNAARHLIDAPDGNFASNPPSLGKLSTEELSNFCGECHRNWDTVVRAHWRGPVNVRFAPYRLANSKCYNGTDPRIGCTACHNPHENAVHDASFYDGKCLACHLNNGAPAGKVGQQMGPSRIGAPRMLEARFDSPAVMTPLAQGAPAAGAAPGLRPFAPACPVAKKDCTSCHMPKVTLPDSSDQLRFTDHQIRVVRPDEPYPN